MKAVLLLALAAGSDPGCIVRTTDQVAVSIRGCVVAEARRLERSGADPRDVATAAIANCRAVFSDASVRLNQCEAGLGGPTLIRKLESSARNRVVREVVEIRASRSSQ